jgi:hypothetical protein
VRILLIWCGYAAFGALSGYLRLAILGSGVKGRKAQDGRYICRRFGLQHISSGNSSQGIFLLSFFCIYLHRNPFQSCNFHHVQPFIPPISSSFPLGIMFCCTSLINTARYHRVVTVSTVPSREISGRQTPLYTSFVNTYICISPKSVSVSRAPLPSSNPPLSFAK